MAFVGLVLEADAGAPENRFVGGNAVVGEPLLPPVVARVDAVLTGKVAGLERPAELALDRGNALRAGHWREGRFEQPVFLHSLPTAAAAADRDVGIAAAQVAKLVAG